MIYLDNTALAEIARRTDHGRALAHELNRDMTQVVLTSVLSEVQLAWLLGPELAGVGAGLLRRVSRYEIDAPVRWTATALGATTAGGDLATAVHVATALVVLGEECTGFATTAPGRAAVAAGQGLPLLTPSRDRTPPACR